MKKTDLRKSAVALAAAAMMAAMPALRAYGQEIGGDLTSAARWYIADGTLYLSGRDTVPTTMFGQQSPWHPYRTQFNAVVIEEGITGVGKHVFNGYGNITSLTVAGSVRFLDDNSFSLCRNLAVVEVRSAIPPNVDAATFVLTKIKKAKLVVPTGCSAEYKDTPFWNKFGAIEESGLTATDAEEIGRTLDEPCTVRLYREARYSGAFSSLRVFLNGVEQEPLKNGQAIEMQTDRPRNRIAIKWRKSNMGYFSFDAIPGGAVQINYSAATTNFRIMAQ
ncbi:MAG: leucine-rich repeat domain-containing protein [Tannerella sp.]|jgi:hypothetical protein|nr:leucine-rich repeat domain-containing protein [Tannerella sp.]